MIDNEIKKGLMGKINLCEELNACGTEISLSQLNDILDLISRLQEKNEQLEYKLLGVMHFVDKWLDDTELKQDEVNRASAMREKTLQIVEKQQAEIERLNNIKFGVDLSISSIKTEAIKEFAERLKENADTETYYDFYDGKRYEYRISTVDVDDIDNLVKEMVGEDL